MRARNAVIAVALAVTAGACGAPAKPQSPKAKSDVAPLEAVASAVARDLGTASDSVMRKLGFGPADAATAKKTPAAPAAPAAARRPARRPTPSPAVVPAVAEPAPIAIETPPVAVEEPAADRPVEEEPPAAEPVEVAPVISETPVLVDDSVYSAADPDVTPPVMRSTDLPRWRPSDGASADAVEVMVSRDGGVEHIRLVSEPRRMIDMMALSAAKMWTFDPALKDGSPVRYRLLIASPRTTYRP